MPPDTLPTHALHPQHPARPEGNPRLSTVARTDPGAYTARHLQVLEGLEAVRKRPGMYIGSRDSKGLMHCLWEIIDNAVDEALAGHGERIDVVLHPDRSVEVRDRARGIPVDIEPRTGLTGVEVVFTKLHAGGKFGGRRTPPPVACTASAPPWSTPSPARLDVEVDRAGKTYGMSFRRGEPGVYDDAPTGGAPGPDAPFTPYVKGSELRRRRQGPPRRHRHPDPVLARPPDLREGRRARLRRPGRPRPADLLPHPGAAARRPRRAGPARHAGGVRAERGGVPPRRRDHRVRRVPRPGRPGHRRVAAAGLRHLPRDGAGPRRDRSDDPDRARARVHRRRRAALGHRLRHPDSVVRQHHHHAQGRHPRRRASSRRCSRSSASSSSSTPDGSRSAPTRSRRTTSPPASPPSSPSGWPSRSSRGRPRRSSAPPRSARSSRASSSRS